MIEPSDVETVSAESEPWVDPEPLPSLLLPVNEFDYALLPNVLKGNVHDIANRMQCPPDFVAVGLLTSISSLIGHQIGIKPKQRDDWLVVPNLWGACIGRPGVLKSPALNESIKHPRRLELNMKKEYEASKKDRDAAILVVKVKGKSVEQEIAKALKAHDKDKAQQLALEVQDIPEEKKRIRLITNDATVEKLGEILADSKRCILTYRDELSAFLRSMDREDKKSDRGFYLEAWNGTSLVYTYDRIGRGTIDIERPCVSILGSIQPGPLQSYISGATRGGEGDDGLLQRFQLAVWPDVSKTWKNVDKWPDKEAKDAVFNLFNRLLELDIVTPNVEESQSDLIPYLRFDGKAQDLFDEWRSELEHKIRNDEYPPALEAHMSKYRSLIPSLALIFHVIDHSDLDAVGEESILLALAWAEYLESHARRIYNFAHSSDLAVANELYRHIVKGDLGAKFTERDVYRKCWALLDRDGTKRATAYLSDFGYLREVITLNATGRPGIVWHVNPAVFDAKNSVRP